MWIDDQVIARCHDTVCIKSWVPKEDVVVLGRSNKGATEVNEMACKDDEVPILKRYGGGGTVLLYPGCLVVSVGAWVSDPYQNDKYFHGLNQAIIRCLQVKFQGLQFSQRGYSDIVVKDKKFVGTSLFRSRKYLLYQASILVDLNLEKIDKYLKHPSKEPGYRQGRQHSDFLTSLNQFDRDFNSLDCLELISCNLRGFLDEELGDEWSEPNQDHIPYLLKRANIES